MPFGWLTFEISILACHGIVCILGKELAVAYQGRVDAGMTTISFDASDLASGQYMYRLESNGYSVTKMMTLLK